LGAAKIDDIAKKESVKTTTENNLFMSVTPLACYVLQPSPTPNEVLNNTFPVNFYNISFYYYSYGLSSVESHSRSICDQDQGFNDCKV